MYIDDAMNAVPILVPQRSVNHVDMCCAEHAPESRKNIYSTEKNQVLTCLTVIRSPRRCSTKETCPNLKSQNSAHTKKPSEECPMFVVNVKQPSRKARLVPNVDMKGVIIVQEYRTLPVSQVYQKHH